MESLLRHLLDTRSLIIATLNFEMLIATVIRLLVFCETNGKGLRFTIKVAGLKHSTAYSK
jgi:hypothetical protein